MSGAVGAPLGPRREARPRGGSRASGAGRRAWWLRAGAVAAGLLAAAAWAAGPAFGGLSDGAGRARAAWTAARAAWSGAAPDTGPADGTPGLRPGKERRPVRVGLEVLLDDPARLGQLLGGRRVGLLTNPTGVDHALRSTVDLLFEHPEVRLTVLLGPEHGLRGDINAGGQHPARYVDPRTGLDVFILYGAQQKPSREILDRLDVLVVDLQDAGVRFYTYLSSLLLVLEAAAEHGTSVVVLDRPNPITGTRVEGPMLDPAFRSFVGYAPVPLRHGMTLGELALYLNATLGLGADVHVVAMEGWTRELWFDETDLPWVLPSHGLPTVASLVVYPGTCLFEGTTLSEGRGTTRPFEWIGAPWVDPHAWAADLDVLGLEGVRFRPVHFRPDTSKHKDRQVAGLELQVVDREAFSPLETAVAMLATARARHPEEFGWRTSRLADGRLVAFIDLLAGTDALRSGIEAGLAPRELVARWDAEVAAFRQARSPYLLYPAADDPAAEGVSSAAGGR